MKKPVRAGRNDPCPCGSGRKFKRCCEARGTSTDRFMLIALAGALLGALLLGLASFSPERATTGPRQVWSPEHGHYHDVP